MLKTDPARTRKIIKILLDWYPKRTGVFEGADLPESRPLDNMAPDSYERVMFYTLTVSIDYMRSASDLWDSARKTINDEGVKWVFQPRMVSEKTMPELVEALSKHKLSKKRNRDAEIWRTICLSLLELFDGDPRNLFKEYDYNAYQIFDAMRNKYGKRFPYLAGSTGTSKILSLWIRIMHKEAGIPFKGLELVPIPIDIHTARATITTGCVAGDFEGKFGELVNIAKKAWVETCTGTEYYPLQLDEALWNLGRFGCSNIVNGECQVYARCELAKHCTANKNSSILISQNDAVKISTSVKAAIIEFSSHIGQFHSNLVNFTIYLPKLEKYCRFF